MPCFHPLRAFKVPGGVSFSESDSDYPEMHLPCGRCQGCRLEHSRQWAVRCMHEASLYPANCCITLTYSDEFLPGPSLDYKGERGFQPFMKRLREWARKRGVKKIRFFMCGEYGEKNQRPHFHALLFNFDFLDKTLWQKTSSGSMIYRSALLEKLWPWGHSSVGELNFESAAYVARYAMKKLSGDAAHVTAHGRVDLRTGEILPLKPEFIQMSRMGGIGKDWLLKYVDEVYSFDRVVINGVETKPPRYYDKLIQEKHPFAWHDIKMDREERAIKNPEESSARRLEAKEAVTLARLTKFRREL